MTLRRARRPRLSGRVSHGAAAASGGEVSGSGPAHLPKHPRVDGIWQPSPPLSAAAVRLSRWLSWNLWVNFRVLARGALGLGAVRWAG